MSLAQLEEILENYPEWVADEITMREAYMETRNFEDLEHFEHELCHLVELEELKAAHQAGIEVPLEDIFEFAFTYGYSSGWEADRVIRGEQELQVDLPF